MKKQREQEQLRLYKNGKVSFHDVDSLYGIEMEVYGHYTAGKEDYDSISYKMKDKKKAIQKLYSHGSKPLEKEIARMQKQLQSLEKLKQLI